VCLWEGATPQITSVKASRYRYKIEKIYAAEFWLASQQAGHLINCNSDGKSLFLRSC